MIELTQVEHLPQTGDTMGPRPFRKAAHVALIVVLFGVSSGWLGGL
ncbi:MAG: hypothetical protein P8P70_12450 [Sulfitobacter sp.]|nr:hypothetical protein [Sulfitobacter sp.]